MIIYQMREDTFCNENNNFYIGYGIDVFGEKKSFAIKDITTNKEALKSLIEKCNRLELSEIHIYDVIEDFLNT